MLLYEAHSGVWGSLRESCSVQHTGHNSGTSESLCRRYEVIASLRRGSSQLIINGYWGWCVLYLTCVFWFQVLLVLVGSSLGTWS
jgi:hypothetical protein